MNINKNNLQLENGTIVDIESTIKGFIGGAWQDSDLGQVSPYIVSPSDPRIDTWNCWDDKNFSHAPFRMSIFNGVYRFLKKYPQYIGEGLYIVPSTGGKGSRFGGICHSIVPERYIKNNLNLTWNYLESLDIFFL